MSEFTPEVGFNSTIAIVGDSVVKTSLYHFPEYATAARTGEQLVEYAELLAAEPLRTAELRSTNVIKGPEGYDLQHTYQLVDGPSLTRDPERKASVAEVLRQVGDMSTIDKEGTLAVPFDAKAANFHIDDRGPALIDLFPILTRQPDGSFPVSAVHGQGRGKLSKYPWAWGTQVGAMTSILSTVIDRGESALQKAQHLAFNTDEWCYDVLPDALTGPARDELRRQIGLHFVPYLLRTVRHKAGEALNL